MGRVGTLHAIAASSGPGSQKLSLLVELLRAATPLETHYLLRLGIGTPTILDALAQVYAGGRAARPVLQRGYSVCCDIGLVAATLAGGGPAAVERLPARPGNPIRAMSAQRLSDAAEILDELGGRCAAEYKYDGMGIQAHRTADGQVELFARRLVRVSGQFPDVVRLLAGGLQRRPIFLATTDRYAVDREQAGEGKGRVRGGFDRAVGELVARATRQKNSGRCPQGCRPMSPSP